MVLKPLKQQQPIDEEMPYGSDSPTLTCEICGKQAPSHLMINLMIGSGSPGHPRITGFQCPGGEAQKGTFYHGRPEHWACSLDCWEQLAHACITGHMLELLKEAHRKIGPNSPHYEHAIKGT